MKSGTYINIEQSYSTKTRLLLYNKSAYYYIGGLDAVVVGLSQNFWVDFFLLFPVKYYLVHVSPVLFPYPSTAFDRKN